MFVSEHLFTTIDLFFTKIYVNKKITNIVYKIVQIIAGSVKRQILAPFLSLLASAFD